MGMATTQKIQVKNIKKSTTGYKYARKRGKKRNEKVEVPNTSESSRK